MGLNDKDDLPENVLGATVTSLQTCSEAQFGS